jgi:hypothetical protein
MSLLVVFKMFHVCLYASFENTPIFITKTIYKSLVCEIYNGNNDICKTGSLRGEVSSGPYEAFSPCG